VTSRESLLGKCDPQKAADLDMFIYLGLAEPGIIFFYPKGAAIRTGAISVRWRMP
jgi:hypothetical protein